MTTRAIRLLIIGCSALLVASCGGNTRPSFDVGLQKVALDLAFKDDKVDAPTNVPPESILEPLPVASQAAFALSYADIPAERRFDRRLPVAPITLSRPCPDPPPGARPSSNELITRGISTTIAPGRYPFRDNGEFEISGPFNFKGPLPPYSVRDYVNTRVEPNGNYAWDVVQPLGPNVYIKRSFNATPTALQLVKLTYKLGDGEFVFQPSPPINMMDLGTSGGEGATWDSAGTDLNTNTAMIVRGGIDKRDWVNVCGNIYEAFKIHSSERVVSLSGAGVAAPFTSFTDDVNYQKYPPGGPAGSPNYYWVAPQFGGIFLVEETHVTTSVGASSLSINGVESIMTLKPSPVPAQ